MTTLPTTASSSGPISGPTTGPTTGRAPRKATRDTTSPIVGGVAAGLAHHLAWPTVWVRAGFVVTAVMGFGIPLYAVLWLVLPSGERFHHDSPGLESASRVGKRPGRVRRLADAGPAIAVASAGFGFILLLNLLTGGGILWPLILVAIGIALLWRQADEAQRERWIDATGRINPVRAVFGHGGWASYSRVFAGLTFIALAFVWFALQEGSLSTASDMAVAGLLGVLGLGIAVGPWVARLASDFAAERAERIRTQERADVAAHLHDSVLQTLALIQKNSQDASLVAKLARSQERDLRSWLYAGDRVVEGSVSAALRLIAAEVEDAHAVTVEVVNVGDCPVDERLQPLINAGREAMTNAAKHAGTGRVDVYVEVGDSVVDVFVRDRGRGFELDGVAEDRLGVRNSIIGRMARHGGTAQLRSASGEGTEIRLKMPRANDARVAPSMGREGGGEDDLEGSGNE